MDFNFISNIFQWLPDTNFTSKFNNQIFICLYLTEKNDEILIHFLRWWNELIYIFKLLILFHKHHLKNCQNGQINLVYNSGHRDQSDKQTDRLSYIMRLRLAQWAGATSWWFLRIVWTRKKLYELCNFFVQTINKKVLYLICFQMNWILTFGFLKHVFVNILQEPNNENNMILFWKLRV